MWYSVCGPYDRIQRRRCEGTGEWRLRVLCDTGSALSWARDDTCTALNTTVATALCAINAQVFWYVQCFSDAIRRKHFDFRKSQGDIYSLFCEESLPVLLRGTVVLWDWFVPCLLWMGKCSLDVQTSTVCQCFFAPWVSLGVTQRSNTESLTWHQYVRQDQRHA